MNNSALKQLNIEPSDDFTRKLGIYSKLFLEYNSHTNLISRNDEIVLFEKHIFDSLALNLVPDMRNAKKMLDIGTGGGFPAIPAAVLFEKLNVTGVDSINKKINFINLLAAKMQLKNLQAICSRTEDLPKSYRESFDIVTSRAVAGLNIILEYAMPYLKLGGKFIAYKSQLTDEEIAGAQNAFKKLNCKIIDIINYTLPLQENFNRKLIIIEKTGKTPNEFPRRAGLAKSNPL